MKEIRTSGPLMFSDPNCPTRVGEIINTISEIYDIPNPSEGMQVYVRDEKKTYTITGLKEAVIGGERVPNAKVDTFEAVKSQVEEIDNNFAEMREALVDGSVVVAVANLANAVKAGAVTFEMLDGKLQRSASVVDDLETANTLKPLSANQGKILKGLIDIINGTGEGSTDKKIADAIAKLVNKAPENLDTLRELADWIEEHGTKFAAVVADINDIKNDALLTNSVHVSQYAEKINIGGRSLDGANTISVDIPAATTETAGVMSAEDKFIVEDIKHNINSVEGDNAEELELVDQNGKTLIRVNSNGVSIDEDEVILNKEGIFPKKLGEEESVLLETESGKPIVRVTATGVEIPKVINKSYNCSILPSCYINKTGSIISNGTMNVYTLKTSGLSAINIDLLAPSTNGLPAFVGKKDEQVVTYKNHTGIDRQIYTVDVTSFDTLYINVSKSGGTKVFVSQEELLNYESSISGKVGLFLGDSLMQGVGAMVGYDAVSYAKKRLGCKCYNGGVGGTTMYNDNRGVNLYKVVNALISGEWGDVDSFISKLMTDNTGPLWQELGSRFEDIKTLQARDISFIFINYGANDWKAKASLDNEENIEDVTTVCGSLRYAIRHILEWNPAIQIFVSTPGYRTDEIVTPEINGISMGELCSKIQSTCEEFHIPCWNQYKSNGVNQYNADLYLSDGTHRTATGYALLGQQYANFISNHLNNITL